MSNNDGLPSHTNMVKAMDTADNYVQPKQIVLSTAFQN